MAHYEQALRQVSYRNWRPATLTERRFRLTCSELNGRYTSNEFILEVSVIHHAKSAERVMAAQAQYMRPLHQPLMIHAPHSHMSGPAPSAATVVIVVCIAALVVIMVIGVYRIHTTHQEGCKQEEDGAREPELDWEKSALNITVNPMENVGGAQALSEEASGELCREEEEDEEHVGGMASAESDNSDDDDEEEEEDEGEIETAKEKKLKWRTSSTTY